MSRISMFLYQADVVCPNRLERSSGFGTGIRSFLILRFGDSPSGQIGGQEHTAQRM